MRMTEREFHGAQLRALRQARGVRMADLQRAVGCHYRHLTQFEYGKRHISIELAHRIARALTNLSGEAVSIADFSTETEEAA